MTNTELGAAALRPDPPTWWYLSGVRAQLEVKTFLRDRLQVVFTFLYPIIMLLIFGSVFNGQTVAGGVSYVSYFLAGIAATGIMLSSFQNLGTTIPLERDEGELARLQALNLPPVAYFVGKAVAIAAITVIQLVLLIVLARVAFDVALPRTALAWVALAWATVLGAAAGTVLGIAVAALPRRARSATVVVAPIALVLEFFSGVFFVYATLPPWMRQVAALFPLKWLTQVMRSAFLPDAAHRAEVGGGWERPECAIILAAWTVAGLVLAVRTFSWRPRA